MVHYDIDGKRSSIALRFRPDQPDLTTRVTSVTGTFEIDPVPDNGAADAEPGLRGDLVLVLDSERTVPVTVTATRTGPDFHGDAQIRLANIGAGIVGRLPVRVTTSGRIETDPGGRPDRDDAGSSGRLLVSGNTVLDPKVFGILRPPFLNLLLHIRWRLVLAPVE